jgi:ABC-type lipoprotein export system ATPase subunit
MEVLQAKNLKKIYGSGNNAVHALDGVDLSVKKGEFVAIVGTSGSGKSTLLHMLGGLDRPTSGTVMVDGQDIFSLKEEALTIFRRRKIGFVFQAYNLVPVLNVYESVCVVQIAAVHTEKVFDALCHIGNDAITVRIDLVFWYVSGHIPYKILQHSASPF